MCFGAAACARTEQKSRGSWEYFYACYVSQCQTAFLIDRKHPVIDAIKKDMRTALEEEAEAFFAFFGAKTEKQRHFQNHDLPAKAFMRLPYESECCSKLHLLSGVPRPEAEEAMLPSNIPLYDASKDRPTVEALKTRLMQMVSEIKSGDLQYGRPFFEIGSFKANFATAVQKCTGRDGPVPSFIPDRTRLADRLLRVQVLAEPLRAGNFGRVAAAPSACLIRHGAVGRVIRCALLSSVAVSGGLRCTASQPAGGLVQCNTGCR
jgi:hypothetical protein